MSVNSYLTSLAAILVLKDDEKSSIDVSISTISSRINSYFESEVDNHFQFGSSKRGTILPRKFDENSDIDYMVIFNTSKNTYKPQTYLDQLRRFIDFYYSKSEVFQSHPTIVLVLKHIKFELVPAIYNLWSGYRIPSPASDWNDWMATDPDGFNNKLTNTNKNNNYQIKPLVRLIKYWNALNGHLFNSFDLENYLADKSFWFCSTLKDYFYNFWDGFACSWNTAQYIKDKVQRAKEKVKKAKAYENQGYNTLAEDEIVKLLPMD